MWVDLLEPLCAMVRFARPDVSGLPVQLAHAFFEDKRRSGIAVSLRLGGDATESVLAFNSLDGMIEEALRHEASLDEPDPREPDAQVGPQDEEALPLWKRFTQMTPAARHKASADDGAEVPLWKQYQQQSAAKERPNHTVAATAEAALPDETPPTPESRQTTDTRPISQGDRVSETPSPALKGDLEFSVLGSAVDLRSRFIRELFMDSEEEYVDVIGQLHAIADWPEASRILADNVFRRYKIDIFSETAVAFTNAVEERFKQAT